MVFNCLVFFFEAVFIFVFAMSEYAAEIQKSYAVLVGKCIPAFEAGQKKEDIFVFFSFSGTLFVFFVVAFEG